MILLNLILFAQSFGFENTIHRTPLIMNMSSGSAFVETALGDDTYMFEMCQFDVKSPDPVQSLSEASTVCEVRTPQLKFESESNHRDFIFNLNKKYFESLKATYGHINYYKLVGGVALGGLAVYALARNPSIWVWIFVDDAMELVFSAIAGAGVMTYYSAKQLFSNPEFDQYNTNGSSESSSSGTQPSVGIQVKKQALFGLYEHTLQTSTSEYIKNQLISKR